MPDRRFWIRPFRRRPSPAALRCRELVEIVTDYLEGALAPVDVERFEAHIAGCEGCTAYVRQMRDTLELLGELTPESLSPEAEAELLAAFRDWKNSPA
jgi:anti-sigma factor RsiW